MREFLLNNQYKILHTQRYDILLYIFNVIMLIINPLAGIIFQYVFLVNKSINDTKKINFFILSISIYISLINITKFPEADLRDAIDYFYLVPKYNFLEYLIINGKEPIYYLYVFLSYYIFAGNQTFFVFSLSFIIYYFFLKSIFKYLIYTNIDIRYWVSLLFFAVFSPQLFSISIHIIRQNIAFVLFLYFLMEYFLSHKKKNIIFIILTIFIHSTLILFIIPLIIPYLNKKIRIKNILFILLLIIISSSNLIKLLSLYLLDFINIGFIKYIFLRVSQENYFQLSGIDLVGTIIIVTTILFVVFELSRERNEKNYYRFMYMILILNIFVIVNLDIPEISVRYFFFNYFLIIFVIVSIIGGISQKLFSLIHFFNVFWVFYFFISVEKSVWLYWKVSDLLVINILDLIK